MACRCVVSISASNWSASPFIKACSCWKLLAGEAIVRVHHIQGSIFREPNYPLNRDFTLLLCLLPPSLVPFVLPGWPLHGHHWNRSVHMDVFPCSSWRFSEAIPGRVTNNLFSPGSLLAKFKFRKDTISLHVRSHCPFVLTQKMTQTARRLCTDIRLAD